MTGAEIVPAGVGGPGSRTGVDGPGVTALNAGVGAGRRATATATGVGVEHEGQAVAGGQDDGAAHAGHRAEQVGAHARGGGTQAGDGVEPVGAVVYGEQVNHGSPY